MFSRSRYMSKSSQVYGFIETVEERGKKEEARKGEISWRERFEEESNNVLAFCLSSRFYNFLLHNVKGLTCMWWCYWLLIPAIGREICVIIAAPSRARYPSLLCDNNGNKTIAKEKYCEESRREWSKVRQKKGTRRFVYCQNHHKYSHTKKRSERRKSMAQHYRWRWGLWPRKDGK